MIKFSLPSIFQICLDLWAMEIQSIFALNCSILDFSSHTIIVNFFFILWSNSYGFSFGTNVMVGKQIFEDSQENVKKSVLLITVFANTLTFIMVVIFGLLSDKIINLIVDHDVNPELMELTQKVFYILLFVILIEINANILGGIIKAFGKQIITAIFAFLAYYIVQISFTCLFTIHFKFGVIGVWSSSLISNIIYLVSFSIYLSQLKMNYVKIELEERMTYDELQLN